MKSRNLHIDTIRGVACILLVAFHVIGANSSVGLKIDSGIYREINDILVYVRMPLFTFLSGIVYAYRPFSGDIRRFIKGKVRRIIVPMLVVGTIFAISQANIEGTNSSVTDWQLLHILPVAHFWFLEAIFLIFLVMIPLEYMHVFTSRNKVLIVFAAASILYISNIEIRYFSVSGAIYLFPYFLLGTILQRFSIIKYLNLFVGIMLGTGITLLFLMMSSDIITIASKRSLIGLILGIMSCITLLSTKAVSRGLAKIGLFSYSIYLYHVFFTAGTRITLNKFATVDINILFIISLTLGIAGPIAVEYFFNGTNFTRLAFLGKSKANISQLWLSKLFLRKIS